MKNTVPDRWVVVEIVGFGDQNSKPYSVMKVLASWYGGYAGSDSWKLSSGIEEVSEFEDRYEFRNASGSNYVCYKHAYGMSSYTMSIFSSWKNQEKDDLFINIVEKYKMKEQ